jgi:hypothetical protein
MRPFSSGALILNLKSNAMYRTHDLNRTQPVSLSQALLTGLFAGIMATIVCMIFNVIYRDDTQFQLSDIINVSSLIFVVNIIFLLIGVAYYGFLKMSRRGDLVFIIVFALLTILLAWRSMYVHRSSDPVLNREFHYLLAGVVIIMGLFAAFGIPFLYHNKRFRNEVV